MRLGLYTKVKAASDLAMVATSCRDKKMGLTAAIQIAALKRGTSGNIMPISDTTPANRGSDRAAASF